ncbi:hypothetical protein [Maribacter spongiicola]|uniref:hypothetical protein n=1 Tax=Maribacter spongiicola TaxID=1206753 RepID=UPI003F9E59A8
MILFEFPKILKPNSIYELLDSLEQAFSMEEKLIPDVVINLQKVKKTSLLGILLNYKFIEYTYKHNCFKKPDLFVNDYIEKEWERYGFTNLLHSFVSNKDLTERNYKNLKVQVDDRFIIAPQALLRSKHYSDKFLKSEFLPKIEEYYKKNDKVVSMIFLCLSEILLNFWEHAVDDTNSILVAEGNENHIEIACADTGNGIITTLNRVYENSTIDRPGTLKKAVEKFVTSKKMTNHMGYGLWILNQIALKTKGRFHIYSEGAFYRNDFGKELAKKCGYWKGTIIYLSLPLKKPITLSDIENHDNKKFNDIKINWK